MNRSASKFLAAHPIPGARYALVTLGLALISVGAQAQYKVVGPDGQITYTDQPPAGQNAQALKPPPASVLASSPLPTSLAKVVSRYPVTLYSGPQCRPCDAGRKYLMQRGIPFSERTVTTAADARAYAKLGAESALPMLTIGQQRLQGWVGVDWASYLDAAGYPANSQLPASYKWPASQPLTPALAASAPAAASAPVYEDIRRPIPDDPSVGRSGGIRF